MKEKHVHCQHKESKLAMVLYFIGLGLFIGALFIEHEILKNTLFLISMVIAGYHVILEGISLTISETRENKKFTPNVHILMTLAAIGAIFIGDFEEGPLLILIFAGAHFLEDYAEGKSRKDIISLLDLNPSEARVLQVDGSYKVIEVDLLKVGDKVQVLNGEKIPADGFVIEGITTVDEASISGESLPQDKTVGDYVFGSTINGNGTILIEVSKSSKETVFAKIIELVNQAENNKSKIATTLEKFEPRYVIAVLIIVPVFILVTPFIFNWSFNESFYRGIVFLTVASPCALAASVVPATLSSMSNLARNGILFKGGSYVTNLANIKAFAFDKTGTLTKGKLEVVDYYFLEDAEENLKILASMESNINHPLAKAIALKFESDNVLKLEVDNQVGKGVVSHYNGHVYKIGKPSLFKEVNSDILNHTEIWSDQGRSVVYFAKDEQVIGIIGLLDTPNSQSKDLIKYLHDNKIKSVMITGDAYRTGKAIADMVGVDEVVGNVLPEEKSLLIEKLRNEYGLVAMVGDGINDAPALVKADIGISMGEGTDTAIEVSDAVIMRNTLSKLIYAHKVSKKLNKIIWENIIFSMVVVVILIVLNVFEIINLPLGVIAHEGSTIIVILNGLRLLVNLR